LFQCLPWLQSELATGAAAARADERLFYALLIDKDKVGAEPFNQHINVQLSTVSAKAIAD
jgi:hypothetical protein